MGVKADTMFGQALDPRRKNLGKISQWQTGGVS
jgi:hypothetical protein